MRNTIPENESPSAIQPTVHSAAERRLCSFALRCKTPRSSTRRSATSAKKPIQNQSMLPLREPCLVLRLVASADAGDGSVPQRRKCDEAIDEAVADRLS